MPLEEHVGKAEALVKGLGFHYRTVKLAAGDCSLHGPHLDIEILIPSMNGYKEVSSFPTPGTIRRGRHHQVSAGRNGRTEFCHT
jgi:seryl-tRNA synthetase